MTDVSIIEYDFESFNSPFLFIVEAYLIDFDHDIIFNDSKFYFDVFRYNI